MKKFLILLIIFIGLGIYYIPKYFDKQEVGEVIDSTTGIGNIKKKLQADSTLAQTNCIQLCENKLINGFAFKVNSCIADPMPQLDRWVCVVETNGSADPSELCKSYDLGTADHFVILSHDCTVVRTE